MKDHSIFIPWISKIDLAKVDKPFSHWQTWFDYQGNFIVQPPEGPEVTITREGKILNKKPWWRFW